MVVAWADGKGRSVEWTTSPSSREEGKKEFDIKKYNMYLAIVGIFICFSFLVSVK